MSRLQQRIQRLEQQCNVTGEPMQTLTPIERQARICVLIEQLDDPEIQEHRAAILALHREPPSDPLIDRHAELARRYQTVLMYLRQKHLSEQEPSYAN
jgi:hypothetical protein